MRHFETTDDAFVDGHVIQISPQVSARVAAVHVDDNARVEAGALLVELDPTMFQVALDQAGGNEAADRGKLEQAKAQVVAAQAGREEAAAAVEVAESNFGTSDADLKRYESLDERARSKQQYDNAISAQRSAAAQVKEAKAKLASAESQIATARASVLAAQGDLEKAAADVHQAQVNLGFCRITSPQAGRVTRKNVEPVPTPRRASRCWRSCRMTCGWSPTSRKRSWARCGPAST